jgi:hypothetical protein
VRLSKVRGGRAAAPDRSGHAGWARTFVDGTIVARSVQMSKDGKVIRVHPIHHKRSREPGLRQSPTNTKPNHPLHRSRSVRKLRIEAL